MNSPYVPRLAAQTLQRHMSAVPVTTLRGARHAGKSTLARFVGGPSRCFMTLDDPTVAELARRPASLLRGDSPITIAEIQRAPHLLSAIADEAERCDARGRILVTTHSDPVLVPNMADSLRGRGSYLTLWPMTRRELKGLGRAGLWSELFDTPEQRWLDLVASDPVGPEDWRALARRGGLPTPALKLSTSADRATWIESYINCYLERDVRALSNISSPPMLRRILRELATRHDGVTNQAAFARELGVTQPTMHRYLNLMAQTYMLVRLTPLLPARFMRRSVRPRFHCVDTAVGLHLAGWPEPKLAHLKSLVMLDLLVWRDAQISAVDVCYWADRMAGEVDLVAERHPKLIPINVTTAERPSVTEAQGLHMFRLLHGTHSCAGLILHCGMETYWIYPGILAAPWWRVI